MIEMREIRNFTFQEFINSDEAIKNNIDNIPINFDIVENICFMALFLQNLRDYIKSPIVINSGYRCPSLNYLVGGSKNSQHLKGEAADIIAPKYGNCYELSKAIINSNLEFEFDQLIYEGSWVHISAKKTDNRKEILTKDLSGKYLKGIHKLY